MQMALFANSAGLLRFGFGPVTNLVKLVETQPKTNIRLLELPSLMGLTSGGKHSRMLCGKHFFNSLRVGGTFALNHIQSLRDGVMTFI